MKKVGYFLLLALMFMLLAVKPGWAAKESAADEKAEAAAGIVDEGRGQGFREESETEKKGVECPATFGPIITDTAVPIEKGKFAIQPTFGYTFVTDLLSRNWRRISAGGDYQSLKLPVKFTYGLFENLEIYTVIPFIHNSVSNVNEPGPVGNTSSNFSGLGDINLTFKYRLIEETNKLPTVSAIFATNFPTGHFNNLNPNRFGTDILGAGYYGFTGGFNISKCLSPFVLYANIWYSVGTAFNLNVTDDDGVGIYRRFYPRDTVTINLAAEYIFTPKWVGLFEIYSNWDGGRVFGHKSNVPPAALFSILPAIEYMATDKLSFAMGPGINLFGKFAVAGITPYVSMVYSF
jgi:hypothetical protein